MNKWKKTAGVTVLSMALGFPAAVSAAGMSAGSMTGKEMTMQDMTMKDMTMKDMTMKDMSASDKYKGASMMTLNGMSYVSLRQVAMNLGYTVMWDPMDKSVTLSCTVKAKEMMDKKYTIKLMAGSTKIWVNGKEMMLNAAPMEKMGTTYVSKGFVEIYLVKMMSMMSK
ncbi:copper amine oxidase N-terminal domain-containing protein [Paenibacillus beijingensis]|uniref:Copper amine oxidase-like N-terminal domain-containing protein n=1 Tax=Paenibacillus beijingensis TaxID=1126833 RepID=A0A0D5NER0_9BACL|nr:copper amine oxidase N-terminal domain-containing protein [Paenibacillus beijingensis]AJY73874.1 hypothetical protein VN24_03675 [Paenibacillus beijingensis]